MKLLFRLYCTALFLLQLMCAPALHAEDHQVSEAQAKAAFLVNVAYYVTWPQQHNDSLVIGVIGKGSLGAEWQGITAKSFHGRKVRVFKSNDLDDMLDCNIIYIEESNPKKLARILLVLRDRPVLTVGDSPLFTTLGGSMTVFLQNNRLAFTINLTQARSAGLEISSNLLKLASEVIK